MPKTHFRRGICILFIFTEKLRLLYKSLKWDGVPWYNDGVDDNVIFTFETPNWVIYWFRTQHELEQILPIESERA